MLHKTQFEKHILDFWFFLRPASTDSLADSDVHTAASQVQHPPLPHAK